jgi:hypothetical protein
MNRNFYTDYQQRLGYIFSLILLLSLSSSIYAQTTYITGTPTYTAPANGTITVTVVGGGGGGGGGMSNAENRAGGGGAGGNSVTKTFAVTAGSVYNMVFGAGGAGGVANNATNSHGLPGGSSSFTGPGAAIVASGGTGGSGGIPAAASGAAGVVGGVYYIPVATAGMQGATMPTSYSTANSTVSITGGGGSGATASISPAMGVVNTISVTNQGSGYTSAPTIGITTTSNASGATAGTALFNPKIDAGGDGASVTASGTAGVRNVAGGTGGGTGGGAGATTPATVSGVNGGVATANTGSGGGGGLGSTNFRGAGGAGSVGYIIVTFTALPVELVKFEVKNSEKVALLNWTTASEIENEGFTIQHSTNGKNYESIGEVKGKGTSYEISHYSFEHSTPSVGVNYYRLKQVDFDGKFEYSPVRSVVFGKGKFSLKSSLVNDAITVITNDDAITPLFIYSISGQLMLTAKVQGEQTINIGFLPGGLYILRTDAGDIARFTKQ